MPAINLLAWCYSWNRLDKLIQNTSTGVNGPRRYAVSQTGMINSLYHIPLERMKKNLATIARLTHPTDFMRSCPGKLSNFIHLDQDLQGSCLKNVLFQYKMNSLWPIMPYGIPNLSQICWPGPMMTWYQSGLVTFTRWNFIVSDNGLSPGWRQAIIWTNAGISLIGPLGTNFSEIAIEILTFPFKKMRSKVSSAKWRPFRFGHNVLINADPIDHQSRHQVKCSSKCIKKGNT